MRKDELVSLGISDEVAAKILEINGRDIEHAKSVVTAAKDKSISDLTAERDGIRSQLDAASAALKRFEGINPESIQSEIENYRRQAEETEQRYTRQITQRDQRDWITAKLDEYGVKSPLARRQITTEVMSETDGLKWQPSKDGRPAAFYGFDDYMKAAKAEDATLYLTAEEKAAADKAAELEKKAPVFTGPAGDPAPSGERRKPPKIF